ncbi:hypothetical protein ACQEU3_44175 [Spirillospora sp. CA-253888]
MKRKLILVPVLALSALGTVGLASGPASATTKAPTTTAQDPWPGHHNHYDHEEENSCNGLLNVILLANC